MQGLPGETKVQLLAKVTKFLMREVQTVIYVYRRATVCNKNFDKKKGQRKPVKIEDIKEEVR